MILQLAKDISVDCTPNELAELLNFIPNRVDTVKDKIQSIDLDEIFSIKPEPVKLSYFKQEINKEQTSTRKDVSRYSPTREYDMVDYKGTRMLKNWYLVLKALEPKSGTVMTLKQITELANSVSVSSRTHKVKNRSGYGRCSSWTETTIGLYLTGKYSKFFKNVGWRQYRIEL
jgi:hypothetical protein